MKLIPQKKELLYADVFAVKKFLDFASFLFIREKIKNG